MYVTVHSLTHFLALTLRCTLCFPCPPLSPPSHTVCLQFLKADGFTEIHFFGDKTFPGGNDYEIYEHPGMHIHHSHITSHSIASHYIAHVHTGPTVFTQISMTNLNRNALLPSSSLPLILTLNRLLVLPLFPSAL